MRCAKVGLAGAFAVAAFMTAAQAQLTDHAAHHPPEADSAQSAPVPAPPGAMPRSGHGGSMQMMQMMQGKGSQPPSAPGPAMGADMPRMMRMMQIMHQRMAEQMAGRTGWLPITHVNGYLAFMKAELDIGSSQEREWSAFADVLKAQASNMRSMDEQMLKSRAASWPERLARDIQMLSARVTALEAIEPQARALYGVLSPEQKRLADRLLGRPIQDR